MKSGEWVLLAQMTEKPMKDLIVPNVPTIQMISRSEEQRLLLKYGTSTPNDFGKVYVLPPGFRLIGRRLSKPRLPGCSTIRISAPMRTRASWRSIR